MDNNDKKIDDVEVGNISNLLKIKYDDMFNDKQAYNMALILYLNGIRKYMFFDSKFDVDEIVRYFYYKDKVVDFCNKFSNDDIDNKVANGDNNECKIIDFYDYFIESRILKKFSRK